MTLNDKVQEKFTKLTEHAREEGIELGEKMYRNGVARGFLMGVNFVLYGEADADEVYDDKIRGAILKLAEASQQLGKLGMDSTERRICDILLVEEEWNHELIPESVKEYLHS